MRTSAAPPAVTLTLLRVARQALKESVCSDFGPGHEMTCPRSLSAWEHRREIGDTSPAFEHSATCLVGRLSAAIEAAEAALPKCWNCGGEGSKEVYTTDPDALYGMDVPMECQVCNGEGVTDCPEEEWPR